MAVASGESDYERYIRTEGLLALQKNEDELSNPDEMMFMVVHQSMELWCKTAFFEIKNSAKFIESGEYFRAGKHLNRAADCISYTTKAFPIMLTMTQADYHEIRAGLGRGSGRDSPGFQMILRNTREMLWPCFEAAMKKENIDSIIDIFKKPHAEETAGLYALVQGLVALDRDFQSFRYSHLQMARTEIGLAVKSLKGIPAARMMDGVIKPFFAELWETIEEFTEFTKIAYG